MTGWAKKYFMRRVCFRQRQCQAIETKSFAKRGNRVQRRVMDPLFYKLLHIIGLGAMLLGLGGMMAGGNNRKLFAIWQGVGLIILLVSGFGMLAKMGLGFPHFAIVKTVLWLVIGMLPVILRKMGVPTSFAICISLTMLGIMAWLGIMKPALW